MYSTTTQPRPQVSTQTDPVEWTAQPPQAIGVASPGLKARPSRDLPEAVIPQSPVKQRRHYHGASIASTDRASLPRYEEKDDSIPRRKKRLLIWILLVVILLLVIAGAVVGGVVGSRVASQNNANASSTASSSSMSSNATYAPLSYATSGFSAIDSTGLAVVTDSSNLRCAYQQIANGSIIEIRSGNDNSYQLDNATIVTNDAMKGSPIAAVTYNLNNVNYRSLAYFDTNGNVLLTNTSGNGWSAPTNAITSDAAVTSSPALALCADTDHVKGMRLYYPSRASGLVQELGLNFTSEGAGWTVMSTFHFSNINSGFACTISNGLERTYYRQNSSVVQMYWDFTKDTNKWTQGHGNGKYNLIGSNSDIAATTDNAGNDYIFYRLTDNTLTRGSLNSTDSTFINYVNYTQSIDGAAKFGAAYVGSGSNSYSLLLSQPAGAGKIAYNATGSDGSSKSGGILD